MTTATNNAHAGWSRRVVLAVVVAGLLLLAAPVMLMWHDGGSTFAVAALAFAEFAFAFVVIPAFAGRRGRDSIRWLLGTPILTPLVTGALLIALPAVTDGEAPAD